MNSINSALNSHQFNLKNFISSKHIRNLASECKRFRIFDPATTLYCFLHQVLSQCSCKGALINLNIQRAKSGNKLTSMNTSAYTKAKKRLSESKIFEILKSTGKEIDSKTNQWKWRDRNVFLADGTIINLEETKEIKKKYPLTFSKGKPQGQPKMRLLGLFSLASGAFLDGEIGTYSGKGQSETSMMQKVLKRLKPKSVLILDRFFTCFFMQDLFLKSKIDYVIRSRDKFAKKHLGRKSEKIITIKRPSLSKYQSYKGRDYSSELKVRLIKSSVKRKGFREAKIYIITSFLDTKKYSKKEIEQLYLQRWGVELDIRNLKTTLEASQLKSKTPKMCRIELWVYLLAYNLVRNVNAHVANLYDDFCPRKRSFKTALKGYLEVISAFGSMGSDLLIELLANETLDAKYRREARAIKKRSNRYCYLTVSRKEAKKENWGYSRRQDPKASSEDKGAE